LSDSPERPDGAVAPRDDLVLPFLLPTAGVRGRLVRLGAAADEILTRHDYAGPVAQLLAELLVLTGGLGSLMKFDGIFTLQTKGDGPLRLLVADVTSDGALRAYAEADAAALARLLAREPAPSLPRLCGAGWLAFTVDQQDSAQRYQGIVALEGQTLADCFLHYFRQSEQLPTAIHIAAERVADRWRAGGLVLQRLPENEHGQGELLAEAREEGWRRATLLMATLKDAELLDPALAAEALIWRLFHEEEIEASPPRSLAARCRCSRRRSERVLAMLSDEELAEMTVEGLVTVTCQFCNRSYGFDEAALAGLRGLRGLRGRGQNKVI